MGSTLNRIVSYLIDMAIITILLTVITAWIPISDKYVEASKERDGLVTKLRENEISYKEYYDTNMKCSYIMEKENIIVTLITIVVSLGYFGTFAYYMNGQTLGKKLTRIRIVDNENKDLSHSKMLLRTLIINGLFINIVSTILLLFITENDYSYVFFLSVIHAIYVIISLFFVAFRKDKRGLHDLLIGTKVINVS